MKVIVCVGDYNDSDFPDANDILFWEAEIDDENGHVLKNLILQPAYGNNNEVIDIADSYSQDDLHLTQNEDTFYSEDTQNTFDAKIVPYFYDIDEDGDAHIKEEVVELLIIELNNALCDFLKDDDNDNNNNNASTYDISISRAKKVLEKCKYVVAYNRFGRVSHNSIGWSFRIFKDKESADAFADDFCDSRNINHYARVFKSNDFDDIEDFSYFLSKDSYAKDLKMLIENQDEYYFYNE